MYFKVVSNEQSLPQRLSGAEARGNLAGKLEVLVAEFETGFDFAAFVPLVPGGDEHPVWFGSNGLLPEQAIELAITAVHGKAGFADFGVVVARYDGDATDAAMLAGERHRTGVVVGGPGANVVQALAFERTSGVVGVHAVKL